MKVLIACEYSGTVRKAFRELGHDAWSCDLLPSDDNSEYHIKGDVAELLQKSWDLMIAHPPCTYLCNSGVHWLGRQKGREEKMREGALFFKTLLEANIPKICVENPIMHKYAKQIIGCDYAQTVQPWQFGEDASKATCLWLKGLQKLEPTNVIKKDRYANQTPSGQNKLGPSADRWKIRSKTYEGIARAMAEQWGKI
jgi:hypothetical protein